MPTLQSAPGARAVIDGREVDYFCGAGYLGFQGRPELVEAACRAARRYGLGSATSRKGLGDNPALQAAEDAAAAFFGTEAALYYASGFMGNTILLQGLADAYDAVFLDEDAHYSIRDAASLAAKPVIPFRHADPDDLATKLRDRLEPGQRPLAISDGVFSVSGDIAPLPSYLAVLRPYAPFTVCLDDAHAVGVLGERGRGSLEHHGLSDPNLFVSATLSKALGSHGGIIGCTTALRQRLTAGAPVCYAASAPPPPVAAASARAFALLQAEPGLLPRLRENTARARAGLRSLGFGVPDTPVPIICLSSATVDLSGLPAALLARGIAISRYYASGEEYCGVPAEGAVRIAVFATHTHDQIDRLVDAIKAVV